MFGAPAITARSIQQDIGETLDVEGRAGPMDLNRS